MNYQKTVIIRASDAAFINKAQQSKDMMSEDDIPYLYSPF